MLCLNCNIKDAKIKFCSSACAATYNNHLYPKRKKTKICNCGNLVASGYKYCEECRSKGLSYIRSKETIDKYRMDDRTTLEALLSKGQNDANKFSKIRGHAKRKMKNKAQICSVCAYDLHVEVCHKISIKDWPLSATVGEINAYENLILLCPNCHWEFDSGLLKIGPERFALS